MAELADRIMWRRSELWMGTVRSAAEDCSYVKGMVAQGAGRSYAEAEGGEVAILILQ